MHPETSTHVSNNFDFTDMQMVLCCLLNRGDSLLCDEYTYSHLVEAMVTPKGYNAIPVPMDDFGMTPEALEKVSISNPMTHAISHLYNYTYIHRYNFISQSITFG